MVAQLREPGSSPGPEGPPGPPGPAGPAGGAAYTHTQDVPSSLWLIGHMLGTRLNVTVVDTLDREVEADVQYVDADNITIGFASPATGKAYLS